MAGTNDILNGQYHGLQSDNEFSGTALIRDIKKFKQTVLAPGVHLKDQIKNTFAVGTIPYSPNLCHLPDGGPLPSPNFVNHYEMMKWINSEIQTMNKETGQLRAPTFHKLGIRVENRRVEDRYGNVNVHHTSKFRKEDWQGDNVMDKLYLTDNVKVKMGQRVIKYFENV